MKQNPQAHRRSQRKATEQAPRPQTPEHNAGVCGMDCQDCIAESEAESRAASSPVVRTQPTPDGHDDYEFCNHCGRIRPECDCHPEEFTPSGTYADTWPPAAPVAVEPRPTRDELWMSAICDSCENGERRYQISKHWYHNVNDADVRCLGMDALLTVNKWADSQRTEGAGQNGK